MSPLLIRAQLCSPLVAEAPRLDALLMAAISSERPGPTPVAKIDKAFPAPAQLDIAIPIARELVERWWVARCSDPIYGDCPVDYVEHITKRLNVEDSLLVAPELRRTILTIGFWTKNRRVPQRSRLIRSVHWFAVGERREVRGLLKRIGFLGRSRSIGGGRVARWIVERTDADHSWFCGSPGGTVLMPTLPAGSWLPADLVGYRKGYGSCAPPYWHPERYTEIVVPC